MQIWVINGSGGAGKDSFVEFCKNYMPHYILNISTVDFVKQIATKCGWDGTKDDANRKFLSDLKDLLSNAPWGDVPLQKVEKEINNFRDGMVSYGFDENRLVVFIHAREPKNIQKIVDLLDAKTLLVRRAAVEGLYQNHADAEVLGYNYDLVIQNDGTLEELQKKAVDFCQTILGI